MLVNSIFNSKLLRMEFFMGKTKKKQQQQQKKNTRNLKEIFPIDCSNTYHILTSLLGSSVTV